MLIPADWKHAELTLCIFRDIYDSRKKKKTYQSVSDWYSFKAHSEDPLTAESLKTT